MKIFLEKFEGRHIWNRRTYDYEWHDAQGEIVMKHEGRYITLKKDTDEKKEFRYDLATGEFERINHYKTRPDKITRTEAKNITAWFRDCSLITEDEKFAKLFAYAKHVAPNNYKSNVRYIEMFATHKVSTMEQWLSLGIEFDVIIDQYNRLIGQYSRYTDYWDDEYVAHEPHEYNKDLLKYIQKECEKHGHISFRFMNEQYDYWNDGQYEIFKKIEARIKEEPQYRPVFVVPKWSHRVDGEYINILHHETKAYLRNKILKTIKKYNLDLDAFLNYALYLSHVESVDLEKLMADYPDYLSRELHLKGGKMSKMEKYPQTWLSTTFKQQKEFDNLQHLERLEQTGNTEKFDNSIETNKHLEWKNGNYLIRMPFNAEDIRDEGEQMDHCVATYIPRIEAGEKIVMFMRDKEKPEKSLVTVEVIDNAITQAYAYRDTKPSIPCQVWLSKWAKKKGLRITAITLR